MKLIIFGDSHTRSFMNTSNILPFFLGPGKIYNLNNDGIQNIIKSINNFFVKYKQNISKDFIFFLYFGEPNCRYLVDDNYHPFKIDMKLWKNYVKHHDKLTQIENAIHNYDTIIKTIKKYTNKYYIITPTTGFPPSLFYMNHFNKLLKEKYSSRVINIYDKIFIEKGTINPNYLNEDLQYDPVHLNSNISKVFLDILKSNHIINDNTMYVKSNNIDRNFNKHYKFNTYVVN